MEAATFSAPAALTSPRGGRLLRLRSDDQLVALFRLGNDEAFRVIHDRYRLRLTAYTAQMLAGSRADAEDAMQDVFLRAYGALRADDRPVTLRAWLYRVAHNRCIDHLRRPANQPTSELYDNVRSLHDPSAECERREAFALLLEDMRRLPEQQRSALLMRELEGLSYAEMSDALGASLPSVKSLLVRARIGLTDAREARDTACSEIRTAIDDAHDRGVRVTGQARRHLRDCAGCSAYRDQLRRVREGVAALGAGPTGWATLLQLLGMGGAGAGGGVAAGSGTVGTLAGAATVGGTGVTSAAATGTATMIGSGVAAGSAGSAAVGGAVATGGVGALASGAAAGSASGLAAAGAAAASGSALAAAGAGTGMLAGGSLAVVGTSKVAALVAAAAVVGGGAVVSVQESLHKPRPAPLQAGPHPAAAAPSRVVDLPPAAITPVVAAAPVVAPAPSGVVDASATPTPATTTPSAAPASASVPADAVPATGATGVEAVATPRLAPTTAARTDAETARASGGMLAPVAKPAPASTPARAVSPTGSAPVSTGAAPAGATGTTGSG